MKDLVAEAIGRTLGVSSKRIMAWDLRAQQGGMPGMMGVLRTQLLVKIVADRAALERLQQGYMHEKRHGSWVLQAVTHGPPDGQDWPAELEVMLLYGKETQHIFKALARQATYRRNQKSKRK